ncbi:putative sialate O-acetylesterase [Paenibacillus agaridevorans]|uniref:Putative sialate O-acetylesterase n=2 Tax=Paenibacillus agaridevorans TaxID=171404 RepID=A0A2R5ERZ5_9BACL|nr:putative sialate O-acetylesterase [Paenibacillus agaridevorans]
MGDMKGTSFQGVLNRIPVGSYGIEFRVLENSRVAETSISPVFVGDLWLLAGQSNMEGCGKEIDVEEPEEGVSCFYMGDYWGIAEEPLCWLQEAVDPVHWGVPAVEVTAEAERMRRERFQGAGLGLTFGKQLLKETGVPIGLIMAAHGGTNMLRWDPARLDEGGHSLYGAMIRKVRKLGGRIKGLLWYQGESDANEGDGPFYKERTIAFIKALRGDTGNHRLPIIYAQLAVHYSGEEPRWWNHIQQEQWQLDSEVAHVYMVPTIDASMSDGIHLDSKSLQNVGRRMAWEALRYVYNRTVVESGPRPHCYKWNEDRTELRIFFTGVNEKLNPARQIFGFKVEAAGEYQSFLGKVTPDRQCVILSFERPVPENAKLFHGLGRNPLVNVRDSLGIPLPVFGPVLI